MNWVSNVDDATTPTVHQVAFYNHTAADDSSVFINTPLTSDAQGDVYFGVQVTQANPNVQSSLVRLGADGSVHTFNVAQNWVFEHNPELCPGGFQRWFYALRGRQQRQWQYAGDDWRPGGTGRHDAAGEGDCAAG